MDAEVLIGTVLGSCTLERLIGQGGMGAVFLAQQSRPRRQVAVKVLLPNRPLTPAQHAAFLERFRRETDALASLEHPNIVPVYEYGEQDGLVYLVMSYVRGGTLRDVMERENQLPLAQVVNYLDQIAAALDLAHERGVIHRDVKPANILVTGDGRLLLTDFGLVKIVTEGQEPLSRLTGEGMPLGTPDYMAPEQVTGDNVDARADLYSLGIILYEMVTGTTPFQSQTPMQIVMQHLHVPPPPPRMLRPDLPTVAEQVILRVLAKRPADRYMRAQDLSNAFRMALTVAGVQLEASYSPHQSGQSKLWRLHLHPLSPPPINDSSGALPVPPESRQGTTGRLMGPQDELSGPTTTGTLKLTQPVKVVKVPIAGRPGLYMTGLLPVMPAPTGPLTPPVVDSKNTAVKRPFEKHFRMLALIVALLVVLLGSSLFWLIHTHTQQAIQSHVATPIPNAHATAMAQATATADANIILIDSLKENIHNWPISTSTTASKLYVFKNGAYHITDNDPVSSAIALLPLNTALPGSFVYTLSFEEVKGDDTSVNNQFGMILRFSTLQKNGKTITRFYAFEVANTKSGEYQFWKYDNSVYSDVQAWTKIWSRPFGSEFHAGHARGYNVFKVAARGSRFTFTVNGKQVGSAQDGSLTNGQIGMLVNLRGTEVAFSNLLLTYN